MSHSVFLSQVSHDDDIQLYLQSSTFQNVKYLWLLRDPDRVADIPNFLLKEAVMPDSPEPAMNHAVLVKTQEGTKVLGSR